MFKKHVGTCQIPCFDTFEGIHQLRIYGGNHLMFIVRNRLPVEVKGQDSDRRNSSHTIFAGGTFDLFEIDLDSRIDQI